MGLRPIWFTAWDLELDLSKMNLPNQYKETDKKDGIRNSKKPTVNQQEVEEINHGVYTMQNSENRQET